MIGDPIALGIGTPSSIPVFLLVGLSPTGPIAPIEGDLVTTARAYFRRSVTTTPGLFRRTVTTEDAER